MHSPKPCPICGGKPEVYTSRNPSGFACSVRCYVPSFLGSGHEVMAFSGGNCSTRKEARDEAIAEWNRRAEEGAK